MSADPIQRSGPDGQQELFRRFVREAAEGAFSVEDVNGAAGNMLVNAIRQAQPTKAMAEAAFDELFAKLKTLLLDGHYDAAGRKRGVFPFNQVIHAPLIVGRNKINGV